MSRAVARGRSSPWPPCLLAASAAAGALFLGDDKPERPPALRTIDLELCRDVEDDAARECFIRKFQAVVEGRDDPRPAVQAITDLALSEGGFLLANCHVVMHTVGRTYARDAGVEPRDADGLPAAEQRSRVQRRLRARARDRRGAEHRSRAAGASRRRPVRTPARASSATAASTASDTRSCGSTRTSSSPRSSCAWRSGRARRPDCAQGAYHDYWFAVQGADDARLREQPITDPRRLCGAQPEGFVRPCWYRAFLENRSEGFQLETPEDLEDLCEDLDGIQRGGCITGAALIGPPDPAAQLRHLRRPRGARRTPRTACAARRCRTCSTRPRATTCG